MGSDQQRHKIILAITGATGAILGIRALELLHQADVETHLIISEPARLTISRETSWEPGQIKALADFVYQPDNIAAPIASGSFSTQGMLILPCSIKTLSQVANAHADNLIARSADVCLKEGRPLILAVRETPLHRGHIRLMDLAAKSGAVIAPPMPVFYHRPQSLDEMTDMIVSRLLKRLGLHLPDSYQWSGMDNPTT
ncbi:MAG: UbiX family flavin prenyltransferase [Anaerolineaceae bacterium]|nr:UbiX family flavin prenyltransferase [Anaerolineaceae bacterium]